MNTTTSAKNNADKVQRQSTDTASNTQDTGSMPNEWSNLEDLVSHLQSGNNQETTSNAEASHKSTNNQPSQKATPQPSQTNKSPPLATVTFQRTPSESTFIQRCADDSATDSASDAEDDSDTNHDYSQYLELLVQEVYSLLRQRLSLERERRGPKYPR